MRAGDVTQPQFFTPRRVPGEPEQSRSGKWSPFELAAMEAEANATKQRRMYEETIKYRKELMKPGANPVDYRGEEAGETLAAGGDTHTAEGLPIEPGKHYKVQVSRGGQRAIYGPIPPQYKPGDVEYNPDTKQWENTSYNPQTGTRSVSQGPGEVRTPGVTWKMVGQDAQGIWWEQATDEKGNVQGYRRAQPSTYQAGTETTREQPVNIGGQVVRQEYTTTRKPAGGTPTFTPPGGAGPAQPPTTTAPAIPPPPSTAPPLPGQPAVPQGAAPTTPGTTPVTTPAVVPTPIQKPIAARTSQEAMAAAPKGKATTPITPTIPVDPKNVGPSLREDFEPTHPAPATSSAAGQPYSKRMNVIQRTAGPLTRFQREKFQENETTLRQTIERVDGVLQRSGMLDNLLTASKLEIAIDPYRPYQLVTRTIGRLSPEEAQLAADFTSLKEDIQKMRQPMGGAGFRSLEAFLALQAQRGSMLGSPMLTRNVLRNSLRVFLSLHATSAGALASDSGGKMTADDTVENLYLSAYGNDAKKAARAMKLDGYSD